jgi:phosphate-selective porin OprO/OprP
VRAAFVFALLLLLTGPAWAQAADPPDAPPEQPAEEGLEHEVIEWQTPERPDHLPSLPRLHGWRFKWRDGFQIIRDDAQIVLQFGGRLLLDAAGYHLTSALEEVAGESGWNADSDVRQARIYGRGIFFDRFFATADVDVKEGEMRDVYLGVRGLGPLGTLQVGYMNEPFSLEERTSTLAQPFMERSIANVFAPDRGSGWMLTNTLLNRRVRWAGGLFFVVDNFNDANLDGGFDDSFDLALRVNGLPLWQEGADWMVLGVSYGHRFNITDDIKIAERPESFLVAPLLDTGPIPGASGLDRFSIEAAWARGRFNFQAEGMGMLIARDSGPNLRFWGGYALVTVALTGERRAYGRKSGTFGRIVPIEPFDRKRGTWGALELAARISYADLDDQDIRGGRELNGTLGFNWIPFNQVKFSTNYVLAHRLDGGWANILQARIQLDY